MGLQLISVEGIVKVLNAYLVSLKEIMHLWNNHPGMPKPLGEMLMGTSYGKTQTDL